MDLKIKEILNKEKNRQQMNIELIASENYASSSVMELQGSIFTNKYAEGYPNKRYYGGCENVDELESLAIEYAKELFGAKYVNVQPHSGSSANMAVYRALLEPNDKVIGMNLSHGGHLTHGSNMSFSGQDYNVISYDVDVKTGIIDYDKLEELVIFEKPKLVIAGASAYSRIIDFKRFREICDKVGAYLMVDMAHIAGLVAAGLHPNPINYADVVTSTTHKTLRGPRGGIILTNYEEVAKKINKVIFPGIQGGPLMHVIAAKAQCFYEALQPEFIDYQNQVLKNIKALSDTLVAHGFKVISDGTDNHLILVDVKSSVSLTGKEAEEILDSIHITVNKNTIPNETEKPFITSGIRLGSPAMTTRGLKEDDFVEIGNIIVEALEKREDMDAMKELKYRVLKLIQKYPLN